MFVKNFLSSEPNQTLYREGLQKLLQSGFIAAMYELRATRFEVQVLTVERAAIQGAYGDGYSQAIKDLTSFLDNTERARGVDSVPQDYGAIDKLLKDGTFTKEEAEALKTGKIRI